MSRQTTNYNLTKPDYTDTADIAVINSNMDIIDEALKVTDTKAQNVMSKNSSVWSSTTAYTVNQYCIYNNSLWKCLVQHSGQTPQEGTYWTKVSLDVLSAEVSSINQNLTPTLVTPTVGKCNYGTFSIGTVVRYGKLVIASFSFTCTTTATTGTLGLGTTILKAFNADNSITQVVSNDGDSVALFSVSLNNGMISFRPNGASRSGKVFDGTLVYITSE